MRKGRRVNNHIVDTIDRQCVYFLYDLRFGIALKRFQAHLICPCQCLQMLIDISEFADLYETLAGLPVEVVIDHMGHMPASIGVEHPGFAALLRLTREGKVWVKLSGASRITNRSDMPYVDTAPYARALIQANPSRILWASDWPHVCLSVPMPDDTRLLEEFYDWADDDEGVIRQIMVDNPARLYGF